MKIYEYKDLEGNIRIREVKTNLESLKASHKAIFHIPFLEFKTRDEEEGIMYFDIFFNRIVVALD